MYCLCRPTVRQNQGNSHLQGAGGKGQEAWAGERGREAGILETINASIIGKPPLPSLLEVLTFWTNIEEGISVFLLVFLIFSPLECSQPLQAVTCNWPTFSQSFLLQGIIELTNSEQSWSVAEIQKEQISLGIHVLW